MRLRRAWKSVLDVKDTVCLDVVGEVNPDRFRSEKIQYAKGAESTDT